MVLTVCISQNITDVSTNYVMRNTRCITSTSKNITRLQRVQNAAARVVVRGSNRRSTNSSNLLEQLHWLPIEWRIKFKIAWITYKTVSTTQSAYLHSLLKHYVSSRTLRSSGSNLLLVRRVHTGFGSRSLSVAASIIWNSLPFDIRNSSTISCFRRQLKTFFYKAAFRPP